MSGRESIPQWNGTDDRADDKPKPKPKKEKQAPEDRTQRKISSFLKSGHKKRPASTERDESVVTAQEKEAAKQTVSFVGPFAEKPQTSRKPKRVLRNHQALWGGLKDVVESDYEVKGDDPQWTAVRRQNRILRHGERLKLQPGATASPAVALSGSGKVPLEKVV